MTGMDRYTGKALDELAHIRQSIADILSTRLGVLVMLRAYGSRLYTLVDDPVDQRFRVEVQAAAVPNDIFDATNWWTSDRGISSFILETVKYPVYFFWSEEPTVVRND